MLINLSNRRRLSYDMKIVHIPFSFQRTQQDDSSSQVKIRELIDHAKENILRKKLETFFYAADPPSPPPFWDFRLDFIIFKARSIKPQRNPHRAQHTK